MYRVALSALIALLSICNTNGQSKTTDFEMVLPTGKVPHSLYRTIRVLDSRLDTTNMGVVQVGMLNAKARVVPKTPFPAQLQSVLDQLVDSAAGNGELLLQLRKFSFAEVTKSMSEKGFCYLRLILYAKTGDGYHRLDAIDTMLITGGMDVTKPSARKAGQTVTAFIANSLAEPPTANQQILDDYLLTRVDSIEKRQIKIYNTSTYTEGLYKTFTSFINQTPDDSIVSVDYDSGRINTVRIPGKKAKGDKVKLANVYAIVYQGIPYIATEFFYYPLKKKEDDFYFTGLSRMNPSTGDMVTAQLMLGIIGGLLVQGDAYKFEMRIDHLNGHFVRIKQIH